MPRDSWTIRRRELRLREVCLGFVGLVNNESVVYNDVARRKLGGGDAFDVPHFGPQPHLSHSPPN